MIILWPVTKEAASEHNHTTATATSSGVPMRPTGAWSKIRASNWGSASMPASTIGVRIQPGTTVLTRIPALAYSSAAAFGSQMTPCLLAIKDEPPRGEPNKPYPDDMWTMAPLPCTSIWGISYFDDAIKILFGQVDQRRSCPYPCIVEG